MNWKTFRERIGEEHEELTDVLPDIRFRLNQLEWLAENAQGFPGDSYAYLKQAIHLLKMSESAFEEASSYVKGILDWDGKGNYKPS